MAGAALLLVACRGEPPPDLLLISLDTVRADHLSVYGYARDTSPGLARRARAGAVFLRARSTAPWTLPAHASLLTGQYPATHGAAQPSSRLGPKTPTLAARLSEWGYETAAIVGMSTVERLSADFDHVQMRPLAGTGVARELGELALSWLDEREDSRPWFLFLHIPDAHSDYHSRAPFRRLFGEPYAGRVEGRTLELSEVRMGKRPPLGPADLRHLVNLYDAGLRQLDADLDAFLQRAEAGGHLSRALLLVTSDHGEEFGEHGGLLHGHTLHPELLRVPLLLWGPGVPAGVRSDAPVSLVDVAPTLLAAAGAPLPAALEGVDLRRWLRAGEPPGPPRPLFAASDSWLARPAGAHLRGVRLGRYALTSDGRSPPSLYDLERDPEQRHDIAAERPERARELAELLRRRSGDEVVAPRRPLSPNERAELEALGYLEPASP